MMESILSMNARLTQYCNARGLAINDRLGAGKDGEVYSTSAATAVKVFESRIRYENERDCYLRLQEMATEEILGHNIPHMVHSDDRLLVIEMTVVPRPFLLDFAGALLDRDPEFSEDAITDWQQAKQKQFGANWGRVQMIIEILCQQCGIYMTDVHLGNISFANDSPAPDSLSSSSSPSPG